jgi:hypothetical protein
MSHVACPNCRIEMEEGIVIDRGHANSAAMQEWTEGIPERSFWSGLKLRGAERMPVVSFRCPKCGMLQSFANPKAD